MERPLFYVIHDAQTELHLSRAWRWTKRLLPDHRFQQTKLALANAILAEALTRTQPAWEAPPERLYNELPVEAQEV